MLEVEGNIVMPRISHHPGTILSEEYLRPLGLSASRLAEDIAVPANRLTDIIRGRRGVTADTAIRLGRRFATTPQVWMNFQTAYDLSKAEAMRDYSVIPILERA